MFMALSDNQYIAIIADIKDSKKLENRNEVQKKLNEVLEEINNVFYKDIYSKFIITLGDEFQGLLFNGKNIMKIISKIEREMYPVKLRFGIGIGGMATEINMEMSIGADGPAYYMARDAINYLKAVERRKQTNPVDIRIEIDGNYNKELALMLNTIFSLLTVIKEEWSDRQREVIWDMLEHQDNQTDVAKRLNIKQPTVQKSLSKGKYYAYKEALDTIEKVLGEVRREND